MCRLNETIVYKGVTYKRISKRKLEGMFIQNEIFKLPKDREQITVYVIPCKDNIFSEWIDFFKGTHKSLMELRKWLNEVYYYNCNNQLGTYLNYYIRA